jgi:hypothetical protein
MQRGYIIPCKFKAIGDPRLLSATFQDNGAEIHAHKKTAERLSVTHGLRFCVATKWPPACKHQSKLQRGSHLHKVNMTTYYQITSRPPGLAKQNNKATPFMHSL